VRAESPNFEFFDVLRTKLVLNLTVKTSCNYRTNSEGERSNQPDYLKQYGWDFMLP